MNRLFLLILVVIALSCGVKIEAQNSGEFQNPVFSPYVTYDGVNFTLCADNLFGRQIKVLVFRNDVYSNGTLYQGREWYIKINYYVPGTNPRILSSPYSHTRIRNGGQAQSYSGFTYESYTQNGQTCLLMTNIDGAGPTFNTTYNYRVWFHGTDQSAPCGATMICGSDSR